MKCIKTPGEGLSFRKDPITIALATIKPAEPVTPKEPVSIHLVGAAPFAALSKAPGVELFAATMRDVEKALQPKVRTDPATVLPPEYHDYLDMFSQTETDKLPPHRDADHKIELEPNNCRPTSHFTVCLKMNSKSSRNS